MLVHFLEIECTRTYLSDATAVPVVTSSGDESLGFSTTYTFLVNSRVAIIRWTGGILSWNCSILFICFVNNILKQEGDILHICDDIVSVEINCFRRINKVAYFYFIC